MAIKERLAPLGRRLLPPVLKSRRFVILEFCVKFRSWHKALMMLHFENAEVSRLTTELERLPQARIVTVVPTYRRPDSLSRAIQSALEQSVRDHVVLVVDDAGGLSELPGDPRLFSVSLSSNTATAGVVRNVGIRISRSKYVAFLDDDNEWEPNHLEAAVTAFEDAPAGQQPDAIYTAVQRFSPDGNLIDELSTSFDRKLLRRDNYVDLNALVVRRFNGFHFSRLYRKRAWCPDEDWELVFRLSRRMRVVHVPVLTVKYWLHSDRLARLMEIYQIPLSAPPDRIS